MTKLIVFIVVAGLIGMFIAAKAIQSRATRVFRSYANNISAYANEDPTSSDSGQAPAPSLYRDALAAAADIRRANAEAAARVSAQSQDQACGRGLCPQAF